MIADITPSPFRLLQSLRDVGYDFATAVADLVDNSIAAGASRVEVVIAPDTSPPRVVVADDGNGMPPRHLVEALRLGALREYDDADLGKFGLGLKTASLSQCRRLVVVSRHSSKQYRIASAMLDIDELSSSSKWRLSQPADATTSDLAAKHLNSGTGTVVCWENLDRVLDDADAARGWDLRRLKRLPEITASHLSMVFHRFLKGSHGARKLQIRVNGKSIPAWDPFAISEPNTVVMDEHRLETPTPDGVIGDIAVRGHVLPHRDAFSSPEEFERLSGPKKWNRQQGFYIFRNNRLIQSGGWCGMRAADEHTKLARVSIDFSSKLDDLFKVNIAKMRVSVPTVVRTMLERIIRDVVREAQAAYRQPLKVVGFQEHDGTRPRTPGSRETAPPAFAELMIGLRAAALAAGESDALTRILDKLRNTSPSLASRAGLEAVTEPTSKERSVIS